ncbi:MAG: hypothetical protein GOVbin1096_82 [Prokaryotic dsDNA virus sp.]|nr:MAG: hypothetical protein GOVbin1096_82 [Prokaryotic dsDNA virus sp.]
MKNCTRCLEEKPLSEYYTKGNRLHSECKTCFIKRKIEERQVKKAYIRQLAGSQCTLCGYDRCTDALELHHRDPTKKEFRVSGMWSFSKERIKKEVEKCVLLCSNCHREVHAGISKV